MRGMAERINPVTVKDVRQSLRGRMFRVVFAVNLSLATVVVLFTLLVVTRDVDDDSGLALFSAGHGVYALCALVLVPLLANRSMAAERDDQSLDALLLSGLSTSAIVRGKAQSALVLLTLFLTSSAPFLALGYALHGLDIVGSLAILVLTTVMGAGLCMAGIVVATLTHNRTLDTLALGLQLMVTSGLCWGWIAASFAMLEFGAFGGSSGVGEFLLGLGAWVAVVLGLRAWLFALGVSILAHPEENSSTRLRLTCLVMTGLSVLGCAVAWVLEGPGEEVLYIGGFIVVLLTVGMISIATEPEPLGRRMALDLREDKGPWKRPAAWLLLPGGGRGMALYVLTLAGLLMLGSLAAEAAGGARDEFIGLWTTAAVALTHLGLVSWLNSLSPRAPGGPLLRLRLLVVALPFGFWLLSMLVGLMIDDQDIVRGRAWLNPIYAAVMAYDDGLGNDSGGAVVTWTLLALAMLVANLPRMLRGHGEARAALAGEVPVSAPAPASAFGRVQPPAPLVGEDEAPSVAAPALTGDPPAADTPTHAGADDAPASEAPPPDAPPTEDQHPTPDGDDQRA